MSKQWFKNGSFQVELDNGELKYISYGGIEIARGIYAAVRDQDWNTVTPQISDLVTSEDEHAILIQFTCEHVENEIDFMWKGNIRLMENGLHFEFNGKASSTFLRNRIGFCILHPMEFAGLSTLIHTSQGIVKGEFPKAISPNQPFKEIISMQYEPAPGLQVTMECKGESFEMEDQRNWTDASYKTYCTPLEIPYPVQLQKGETVHQSIELTVSNTSDAIPLESANVISQIVLKDKPVCHLPEIGFTLCEGVPSTEEKAYLKQLRPSFLRLILELSQEGWRKQLEFARGSLDTYRCGLELEVIVDSEINLLELVHLVAEKNIPVVRIIPYKAGQFTSDGHTLQSLKQMLQEAKLNIPVGGGSRTYYAELNRASLPLSEMQFAQYSMNPQVHAFDDRSLMETISAQRVTAMDALEKCEMPMYLGPITLKPRINPNATSSSGISLEDQRDRRQYELFGAAWTLGSIAALCHEEVKGVTYFETSGAIGLVEGHQAYPLYYVFRDILEFAGAAVMSVSGMSPMISALVLKHGLKERILLANKTDKKIETIVDAGLFRKARLCSYYDKNMTTMQSIVEHTKEIKLSIEPYGYMCIDVERN